MFVNQQIEIHELPKIDSVTLKPISKEYFKIIIFNKLLMYIALFAVLFTAKWFVDKVAFQDYFWMLFFVFLVAVFLNFILALLAFKKRKYAVREHDVIYAKGLLIQSVTTVPISRIQHVEESRSWLARQLHLATLKLYTAGESGSDLSIQGLPLEDAKQINDFISAKVNGNS